MHWCRCLVRFNKVPEKAPKVPDRVWEVLVQGRVTFNRGLEALARNQDRPNSNSGPESFRKRFQEALVQGWGQEALVQGWGSFGAEASPAQQGSEKAPGKVPENIWEASVQNQGKFIKVSSKFR